MSNQMMRSTFIRKCDEVRSSVDLLILFLYWGYLYLISRDYYIRRVESERTTLKVLKPWSWYFKYVCSSLYVLLSLLIKIHFQLSGHVVHSYRITPTTHFSWLVYVFSIYLEDKVSSTAKYLIREKNSNYEIASANRMNTSLFVIGSVHQLMA